MEMFEEVRRGSMRSNHPELAHNHPTHHVPLVEVELGKAQCCRTSPNSCKRALHTLLALHSSVLRRFDVVRCDRTSVGFAMEMFEEVRHGSMRSNYPELAHNHPTHLVPSMEVQLGKAQCGRTPRTHTKWLFIPY